MKFNVEKLKQMSRPMTDEEKKDIEFRKENREWLAVSERLALKLRRILRTEGILQSELAERMGVTPAQVTKILSGKENLGLKTIIRLWNTRAGLSAAHSPRTDMPRVPLPLPQQEDVPSPIHPLSHIQCSPDMHKEILYQFINMDLIQFATFVENYMDDGQDIEVANKFRFSYDFEENVMCCTVSVTLSKENGILLKADLASYFGIEPDSAEAMKSHEGLIAPADLLAQFASLAYGSVRGVVFAKTIGLPLNNLILPPNNVRAIFRTSQLFRKG